MSVWPQPGLVVGILGYGTSLWDERLCGRATVICPCSAARYDGSTFVFDMFLFNVYTRKPSPCYADHREAKGVTLFFSLSSSMVCFFYCTTAAELDRALLGGAYR